MSQKSEGKYVYPYKSNNLLFKVSKDKFRAHEPNNAAIAL